MTDFAVVIPSASGHNLTLCVHAIRKMEPQLNPADIIVIDDGARAQAKVPGATWVEGIKPFIFSRAVNQGLRAAGGKDVLLLGDDVILETPGGFTRLLEQKGDYAIVSPGIRGGVGNTNQNVRSSGGVVDEEKPLCFVCVLIPRSTVDSLGEMDEQFTGYGCDDIDYCRRAQAAGMKLGVNHNVIVAHRLRSVYRSRANINEIHKANKALFAAKWGKQ